MKKTFCKPVCALIAAAGKGSRMNMDVNKQYIQICGKPMLARTIQAFEDCGMIEDIVIIANAADVVFCKREIVDTYGFSKVRAIVAGGETRQQSVYNGLLHIKDNCSIVSIHDGARPFISEESIIKSIEAADEFGGACVAVPVKDTIKCAYKDGFIEKTLDRSALWSIQTPQTFRHALILEAYRKAIENGYMATDDAMLAESMGHLLKIVSGSYYNIKITTEEDIVLAEAIARKMDT